MRCTFIATAPAESPVTSAIAAVGGPVGEAVGFLERGELEPAQAHPARDVRCRRVVRHPIDPRAPGATPVVAGKRPPEREVNVLDQVSADVGVGLVGVRQALQPISERRGRFPIEVVLAGPRCLRHVYR